MSSAKSRGSRIFATVPPRVRERFPEERYRRDKDALLHSGALMRLRGVTQVVSPWDDVVLHDRLTHSLKVANVGGLIARRLIGACRGRLKAQSQESQCDEALEMLSPSARAFVESDLEGALSLTGIWRLEPEVVEAAGLAHDLGHPPFGHIGEKLLSSLAKENCLLDRYEGNAQSFRIVTKLALGYLAQNEEKDGLNLTSATLNAILKYPWLRDEEDSATHAKWGAYYSEEPEFKFARTFETGRARSLEAEIMDYADEVAYAVHDLIDFIRARLIPLELLLHNEGECSSFVEAGSNLEEREARLCATEALRSPKIKLGKLWLKPYDGSREYERLLHGLGAQFTRLFVKMATHKSVVQAVLTGGPVDLKTILTAQNRKRYLALEGLKKLTWHYVIESPNLATQQHGQKRVLNYLFEVFLNEALNSKGRLSLFPKPQRTWLKEARSERERIRFVIDFLAGLTEQQVVKYNQRLSGSNVGSVVDMSFS